MTLPSLKRTVRPPRPSLDPSWLIRMESGLARINGIWEGQTVHKLSGDKTLWEDVSLILRFSGDEDELEGEDEEDEDGQEDEKEEETKKESKGENKETKSETKSENKENKERKGENKSEQKEQKKQPTLSSKSKQEKIDCYRGTIRGEGRSLWFQNIVPFTLKGSFDLNKKEIVFVKRHTGEFTNVLYYQAKINLDTIEITSEESSLTLRRKSSMLLADIHKCLVCKKKQKNHLLLPCHDMAVCEDCVRQIDKCPKCQHNIQSFELVIH